MAVSLRKCAYQSEEKAEGKKVWEQKLLVLLHCYFFCLFQCKQWDKDGFSEPLTSGRDQIYVASSSMHYFCVIILVCLFKKCSLFNEMQQCRRFNLLLWRLSSIKQCNQEAIMKSCSKWLLLYIAIKCVYM